MPGALPSGALACSLRPMGRLHLVELEDLAWFPATLRDAGTAYLDVAARVTKQLEPLAPKLREALARAGSTEIIDLCSGSGGPVALLVERLAAEGLEVRATLTDLYPNLPTLERTANASQERLEVRSEPTDARALPRELRGLRTMFASLHHFRPDDARAILRSAVEAREGIAAFELVARTPPMLIGMLFAPLITLFLMPLARPMRFSWLFFTYLVPIIPLFILWDGIVSCLRVYSPDELRGLVAEIDAPHYEWDIGQIPLGSPGAMATYLVGTPKRAD